MATIIERVWLPGHAVKREAHQLSAHGFQGWLDQWHNRQADGWDVTVLVDQKRTHAVALAYRGDD